MHLKCKASWALREHKILPKDLFFKDSQKHPSRYPGALPLLLPLNEAPNDESLFNDSSCSVVQDEHLY